MIGGLEPPVRDIERGISRSGLEQMSPRPRIGMASVDGEVAVVKRVLRQPRALVEGGHEIERRET